MKTRFAFPLGIILAFAAFGSLATIYNPPAATSAGVTSFSAGDLSPLFTTSEATVTTTPALTFTLSDQAAHTVFAGPPGALGGAPTFRTLVAADIPDLSGTYQSLTTNLDSWAAITRASGFDIFVATPSGANFASLLTSALPVSKGGTGATTLTAHGVVLGNGTNAVAITGAGTAGQVLASGGASADPTFQDVSALRRTITQVAHGFSVGQALIMAGGQDYGLAQANSNGNAATVGMVSVVIDANNFVLATGGYVSGLSGLSAGASYFLSPTTPGALTNVEPTAVGQISKPLFIATSTTAGYLFNMRGVETVTHLTNSAGANNVPVSDGTNLITSSITDDGTVVSGGYGAARFSFSGAILSIGDLGEIGNGTKIIIDDAAIRLSATGGFFWNGNNIDFGGGGAILYVGDSIPSSAVGGTTTNNNAPANGIGEYVVASVIQGSAVTLTTATPKTVTSISLTAGDWDVTAIGAITGASTGTEFDVAISANNNSMTGTVLGDSRAQTPTVSLAGADATLMIPSFRVSLASTTTYYLIVQETFTLGSPKAYGRISARRVR